VPATQLTFQMSGVVIDDAAVTKDSTTVSARRLTSAAECPTANMVKACNKAFGVNICTLVYSTTAQCSATATTTTTTPDDSTLVSACSSADAPESTVTAMMEMTFRSDASGTGSDQAAAAFAQFSMCREQGIETMKSDCFDNVQMGAFNFSQILTSPNVNAEKSSILLVQDSQQLLAQSVTYPTDNKSSKAVTYLWFILFMLMLVLSLGFCWCAGVLNTREKDDSKDDGGVVADDAPRKKSNFVFDNNAMYNKQPGRSRSSSRTPSPIRSSITEKAAGGSGIADQYHSNSDDDEVIGASPNPTPRGRSPVRVEKPIELDQLDFNGDEQTDDNRENGDWRKDIW
jgi:hypothetical protein